MSIKKKESPKSMSIEKIYHPIYGLNTPPKSPKKTVIHTRKNKKLKGKGNRKKTIKYRRSSKNLGKKRNNTKNNKRKKFYKMKGGFFMGSKFQPILNMSRNADNIATETKSTLLGIDPETNDTGTAEFSGHFNGYN
tara:strand:+ start:1386 stop:1793 length:408 start_codon:yes stop_codon:yes gene_type:complete